MVSRSSLPSVSYLLDVNVLVARIDSDHVAHGTVLEWFHSKSFHSKSRRATWNLCPFTEAGFLRVLTNPRYPNSIAMEEALHLLHQMERYAGCGFWPIESSITSLVQPFVQRLYGHQQVTDAYLLGLAVGKNGILVTLDKAIRAMAGKEYEHHVLTLG